MQEELQEQIEKEREEQKAFTFETGTYIEDGTLFFQVGDLVQAKEIAPELEETMPPEDYYYITGFAKKKGVITDIKVGNVVNIYVDFDGTIGVFYEHDLKKIA